LSKLFILDECQLAGLLSATSDVNYSYHKMSMALTINLDLNACWPPSNQTDSSLSRSCRADTGLDKVVGYRAYEGPESYIRHPSTKRENGRFP
jgi:hypothetical protein